MKLLRTIALDPSDTFVFDVPAEPGDWAVPGAFRFCDRDPAKLQGKDRWAFRGGFLGVHSATDTFYKWPEYGKLIGGYFDQHPWHQSVRIDVADRSDPLVAFLGASIAISDEIYQIRDFDAGGSHVLMRLDPASVDLTRNNVHQHPYGWPLAWTRAYGNGRVFYTALGHEEAVWRDSRYQTLLRNAVFWAIGGSR